MELTMENGFQELSFSEMQRVEGGGVVAFVYALGFIAGTTPLAVCVGAGLVVVGVGLCIYDACTN